MENCKIEPLSEFIQRKGYSYSQAAMVLGLRHRSSITEKLKYSGTPDRFIVITYQDGRVEGANRQVVREFVG